MSGESGDQPQFRGFLSTPPVIGQLDANSRNSWRARLEAANAFAEHRRQAGNAKVSEAYEPTDDEKALIEKWWKDFDAEGRNLPNRLKSVSTVLQTPSIDWLVPGHIHKQGLMQLYGASYSGKTVTALDLALSVAAGLDEWMGMPLNVDGPQQVLYIAAEGGPPFAVLVDAWVKAHPGADVSGFYVLDGGDGHVINLEVPKRNARDQVVVPLAESWTRLVTEASEKGLIPAMVVWDTQVDIAPDMDENNNIEVVAVLRRIKEIADLSHHLALVVHHTGHDGGRARGASSQKGKCDVQVGVVAKAGGVKVIEWSNGKVKGAAQPETDVSFTITPVDGSEGAVATPISAVAAAATVAVASGLDQASLDKVLEAIKNGASSVRAIADQTKFHRDRKVKPAVAELEKRGLIENQSASGFPKWVVAQ